MAAEGAGHDPGVDEEFARIVAGWDDVAPTSGSAHLPPAQGMPAPPESERDGDASSVETTPAVEHPPPPPADLGAPEPPPDDTAGPAVEADADAAPDEPAYLPERDAWRGYEPNEPDEHFEPPEPDLPPAHDATYWLAVVGMVAGPLLVLWAVVFSGNPDPGWLIVAGLLLLGFGFGLLVMRGSGERDPDDDGSRL